MLKPGGFTSSRLNLGGAQVRHVPAPLPLETKSKMKTQKTLFDEKVEKEVGEEQEEDIKIGIRIAEAEMDHNIRDAFNAASAAKKKKAKKLLQEITAISLAGDEDMGLDTFAKVLALEKVLGVA